jgi:hypothetical protein
MCRAHLNESIVEYEHGGSQVPHPCPAEVEHLTNITNIAEFRVTETEFPDIVYKLRCIYPEIESLTRRSTKCTEQTERRRP